MKNQENEIKRLNKKIQELEKSIFLLYKMSSHRAEEMAELKQKMLLACLPAWGSKKDKLNIFNDGQRMKIALDEMVQVIIKKRKKKTIKNKGNL